jgi:hypothetical protein
VAIGAIVGYGGRFVDEWLRGRRELRREARDAVRAAWLAADRMFRSFGPHVWEEYSKHEWTGPESDDLADMRRDASTIGDRPLRQRVELAIDVLGDPWSIEQFHGDRAPTSGWRVCRFALDSLSAWLRHEPLPAEPAYIAEYRSALASASAEREAET